MIIEIGTSNFATMAGKRDGLFIEPVKTYFDSLPECRKENVAISDFEGEVIMFYMRPEDIDRHKLPGWLKGCNMIGEPHPTMLRVLREEKKGLSIIKCDKVKVVRIKSLIDKYNIKKIQVLKIDTEGHDCVILNDFLDTVQISPRIIIFENNELSNQKEIEAITQRLKNKGYRMQYTKGDIICRL